MSFHSELTQRFDDPSEINDVARYGCAAGVSGFIYYHETTRFYDDHEAEILDFLSDFDISLATLAMNDDDTTTLKNKAVWSAVELWCENRVLELEAA